MAVGSIGQTVSLQALKAALLQRSAALNLASKAAQQAKQAAAAVDIRRGGLNILV